MKKYFLFLLIFLALPFCAKADMYLPNYVFNKCRDTDIFLSDDFETCKKEGADFDAGRRGKVYYIFNSDSKYNDPVIVGKRRQEILKEMWGATSTASLTFDQRAVLSNRMEKEGYCEGPFCNPPQSTIIGCCKKGFFSYIKKIEEMGEGRRKIAIRSLSMLGIFLVTVFTVLFLFVASIVSLIKKRRRQKNSIIKK